MYNGYLNQLINAVLINSQFVSDFGLMKGRLGVVLLLYNYSRYSGREYYRDYADNLIDNVYESINESTPNHFDSGISGIGWGMDYLIKNGFVDGESDMLEDLDGSVGKMSKTDFQTELKSSCPLFSKGLYFIQRGIEGKIAETLNECLDLLQTNGINVPASYMNSILYTVNIARDLNIAPKLCDAILDRLYTMVQTDIDEYDRANLYALKRNIEHITDPDKKREWQKLINNIQMCVTPMDTGWIHFIFRYENPEKELPIEESELKQILENAIQCIDSDNLPMYNGLVGLGLEIIHSLRK